MEEQFDVEAQFDVEEQFSVRKHSFMWKSSLTLMCMIPQNGLTSSVRISETSLIAERW